MTPGKRENSKLKLKVRKLISATVMYNHATQGCDEIGIWLRVLRYTRSRDLMFHELWRERSFIDSGEFTFSQYYNSKSRTHPHEKLLWCQQKWEKNKIVRVCLSFRAEVCVLVVAWFSIVFAFKRSTAFKKLLRFLCCWCRTLTKPVHVNSKLRGKSI